MDAKTLYEAIDDLMAALPEHLHDQMVIVWHELARPEMIATRNRWERDNGHVAP